MKKIFTILLAFLAFGFAVAQSIKGEVEIDMQEGIINCKFEMDNLPEVKNYKILLNKGMNIKYFKNNEQNLIHYDGEYDGKIKGEAVAYSFTDTNDQSIPLPKNFQIEYKGAFPVYFNQPDDYRSNDFKGVIAFNDETLRATEQTKWYPVIYDVTNDKLIDQYNYEVTFKVKSTKDNTIFINGNAPKKGLEQTFTSSQKSSLFIFIGNYDFKSFNGNYLLNLTIDEDNATKLFRNIATIKNSLAKNLNSTFTDNIYIINHKALNKRKIGSSWGFNDYPAFAFTDINPLKMFKTDGQFIDPYVQYFGHEMAHNYFGQNVNSGKLMWFWLESFAEYLSYNVVQDMGLNEFLKSKLINNTKAIENENFIPLSNITEANQINENYRYILAPMMLKCFEDTFGRTATNEVLKKLLEYAKTESLTLQHFDKAVAGSGILMSDYKIFKQKFITNKNFKENIISAIKKRYE